MVNSPWKRVAKYIFSVARDKIKVDALALEFARYQSEATQYGRALRLWLHEYPIIEKLTELQSSDLSRFQSDILPGMKAVFLDYKKLESSAKHQDPKLYEEEIATSKVEVFDKQEIPDVIAQEKIKIIKLRAEELIAGVMDQAVPLLEKIRPFVAYLKSVGAYYTKVQNLENRAEQVQNNIKDDKLWQEIGGQFLGGNAGNIFKRGPIEILIKAVPGLDEIIKLQKEIDTDHTLENTKEWVERVDKLKPKVVSLKEESVNYFSRLEELYKGHYEEILNSFSTVVQHVDSFNQHFVRFIARLIHISNYGDKHFSSIEAFTSELDREGLKAFLRKIRPTYPHLSKFLLSYFALNSMRITSAHNVVKTTLSPDGRKIIFDRIGKPPISRDIDALNRKINSFCNFTSSLPLFYDPSNDDVLAISLRNLEFITSLTSTLHPFLLFGEKHGEDLDKLTDFDIE